MNQELVTALRELAREKGIPFETILAGLEEALASAYKSWRRQHDPNLDEELFGVRAVMDPDTGDLRVWEQELDEEGTVLSEKEVPVTDRDPSTGRAVFTFTVLPTRLAQSCGRTSGRSRPGELTSSV